MTNKIGLALAILSLPLESVDVDLRDKASKTLHEALGDTEDATTGETRVGITAEGIAALRMTASEAANAAKEDVFANDRFMTDRAEASVEPPVLYGVVINARDPESKERTEFRTGGFATYALAAEYVATRCAQFAREGWVVAGVQIWS